MATDATGAVLARLGTPRRSGLLPLSLVAAAAALAAAVVLALAIQVWSAGSDPQAAFYSVVEVTQP